MKISTLDTVSGFDLMLKFIPPVSAILEDAEMAKAKTMLTGKKSSAELAEAITPILLKSHNAELIDLVATMQGCTADEVKAQPIGETVETLAEGVRLYSAFFPAALHLAANA